MVMLAQLTKQASIHLQMPIHSSKLNIVLSISKNLISVYQTIIKAKQPRKEPKVNLLIIVRILASQTTKSLWISQCTVALKVTSEWTIRA